MGATNAPNASHTLLRHSLPETFMPTDRDSFHKPLDTLWQARSILWILVTGEALAIVLTLSPGNPPHNLGYFLQMSLAVQWVLVSTLSILYLARGILLRLSLQQVAYFALSVLLLTTLLFAQALWFLFRDEWGLSESMWHRNALGITVLVFIVGSLGLIAFNNLQRARHMALRAKQAELEALQARIRPHFLFNTLNTGAALVHQRPEAVEQLLLDLSDLFRAALAGPQQISLEDELGLARRYLEIEALRFRERLTVVWKLPRDLPDVTVPALTIQPLVENAIRHGIERLPKGGEIEIAVTTSPERVIVRISNPVPVRAQHGNPGHNVGLNAAQERVEALTRGRGSVKTQREGDFYVATVRLPVNAP